MQTNPQSPFYGNLFQSANRIQKAFGVNGSGAFAVYDLRFLDK